MSSTDDEQHRQDDRRHTIHRAGFAVATFVVVAVFAGGLTALLSDGDDRDGITPSPTLEDSPTTSPTAATAGTTDVPTKTAVLSRKKSQNYWIWAPAESDGDRLLTWAYDSASESSDLDLSRSTTEPDDDVLGYRGQMLLIPVAGTPDVWLLESPPDSEEADENCVTLGEGGFRLEICDEDDEKQQFVMTLQPDGKTYSIYSKGREASRATARYLDADGREITWSDAEYETTTFVMEKVPQE
ncbi:hypothetical protein KIH74_00475 [Kineosporia sp. J2-2]|uniref:Uncharacterized protein n=1 Tax=Kineosporia corallincola TaxID=2835133 RepID=A0ABS5T8H5_9ACTN|nr:hypothetical protein [Kineosporia corallincola]MBT0767374.1 hypothetical protein [Kineosporia corallincola]